MLVGEQNINLKSIPALNPTLMGLSFAWWQETGGEGRRGDVIASSSNLSKFSSEECNIISLVNLVKNKLHH